MRKANINRLTSREVADFWILSLHQCTECRGVAPDRFVPLHADLRFKTIRDSGASPLTCWIVISSIVVLVATIAHHVIPSPNLETKLLAGTLPDRLKVQSGEAIEAVSALVFHVVASRDDRTRG